MVRFLTEAFGKSDELVSSSLQPLDSVGKDLMTGILRQNEPITLLVAPDTYAVVSVSEQGLAKYKNGKRVCVCTYRLFRDSERG